MTLVALQPVSGQTILQGSGSTVVISGQPVTISGNVIAVSGTVTVAGTVAVSTIIPVSGLWSSTTLQSGQTGVSGAMGSLNFMYDYSGLNWVPVPATSSGIRIPRFTNSGDASVTSVSGNVISISGTATIAGAVTTSVSGNVMKPQTPTFVNTLETFRISVASGGVALSSFACVACTVRNIGVSGDVILVGSLSSPPYFGTSGEAYPATSGKGFWLRDGDAITLNTTDTANIKVTANLSGTTIAYIAVG